MSLAHARVTTDDASRFVYTHHRTHDPDQGNRYVLGAWDTSRDTLCGVAVVGNPRAPALAALRTVVEVTRCCTDGTRNACTFLYCAAADVARAMGWLGIITYTLKDEGGASLRAAGWWGESLPPSSASWSNRPGREDHIRADMRWLKLLNADAHEPARPVVASPQLTLEAACR